MAKNKQEEKDTPIEEAVVIWEGKVPATRINKDMDLQVRKNGTDMDLVKEYAGALEDALDDLPPLDVFTTASKYNQGCELLLSDGFTRIEAYAVMQRNLVPVKVYMGDRDAAFIHALEVNGRHGKPFTQKDRIYNVKRILADENKKHWSVRKIAELVGCSKSTVQNIKNPPEPAKPKTRKTTDEPAATSPELMKALPVLMGQGESKTKEASDFPFGNPADKVSKNGHASPPVSFSNGNPVQPAVVRERQESTLVTSEERLRQVRDWVKEGYIDRSDVMNIFASAEGRLVWLKRENDPSNKSLIIRCKGQVLIEADVKVHSDLPAVIDVSVEDPRLVEYIAPVIEADPFEEAQEATV